MRAAFALFAVVVLAGCGVPQELSKQAEEVESVAAEGSLLAHDAGEGDTTSVFAREHSKALRKLLAKVTPAIDDQRLGAIAADVDSALEELGSDPGDEARARELETKLEKSADAAGELAG